MGIPYSREINAAFEQVTPLVAAGFKVLRTTKNISILLAVIQVLTVFFLFLILLALLLLLYCVNPDLQTERQELVTPFLQWLARVTLWDVLRTLFLTLVAMGGAAGAGYYYLVVEQEIGDLEHAGNEDADKALEDMDGKGQKKGAKGGGKEEEK